MLELRLLLILSLQFESTQVWHVQFVFELANSIKFIPTEQEEVAGSALKYL
jgi:hypothetical protein